MEDITVNAYSAGCNKPCNRPCTQLVVCVHTLIVDIAIIPMAKGRS